MQLQNRVFSIIFLLLFSACLGCQSSEIALPYYSDADFTPRWALSNDDQSVKNHRIATFEFINQDGDTINEKTFDGKIYIADFFFTSCPGICRGLTKNLAKVQEAFLNDDEVLLLSHSVTPEIDSIGVLKKYAKANAVQSGKWHLITGNRKAIYAIARNSYFADEDLDLQNLENEFLHTENFYLVDKDRRIRGVYKGTFPTEVNRLIEDVEILKKEYN